MRFPYSQGKEVIVNTKSLKMAAGGREPVKVYSTPERNKPLLKQNLVTVAWFVHQDSFDIMKYDSTQLDWGGGVVWWEVWTLKKYSIYENDLFRKSIIFIHYM